MGGQGDWMELTDRQRQILRFIADYKARHGAPPALREIAQHCKIYLRGDGDAVILMPENEAFAPIRIREGQRFRILGKVIGVFRKL